MYKPLAIILSVASVRHASPLPAQPQHQQLQNNYPQHHLNPNIDPNIDPDNKIYLGSRGDNFRPDISGDDPAPYEMKRNAQPVRADNADTDDVDQNQIMNEISNIIKENNQKARNLKRPVPGLAVPETPVLNEDVRVPVNERDPNNQEQFEKQPRVNERIPIVDRELKVPNVRQRIPIVNEEGIVYNAPKVHERIPVAAAARAVKLNDLEDVNNVDNVINNIDASMKKNNALHKPEAVEPKIFQGSRGENYRPDLSSDDPWMPYHDKKNANIQAKGAQGVKHVPKPEPHEPKIFQGSRGENYRPDLSSDDPWMPYHDKKNGNIQANKAQAAQGEGLNAQQIQNHGDLIHDHHHHHSHRGADMGFNTRQRKSNIQNGLRRLQANFRKNGKLKRPNGRLGYSFGRGVQRFQNRRPLSKREHKNAQKAEDLNPDRIDNRIRALEDDILHPKQNIGKLLKAAPQKIKLSDLENVNNVADVISALDTEPSPVQNGLDEFERFREKILARPVNHKDGRSHSEMLRHRPLHHKLSDHLVKNGHRNGHDGVLHKRYFR